MVGIDQLISSYKKIPSVRKSEPLGRALEHVASSHDPVFVFDDNSLVGMVCASYALFKRRYPLETKVGHAMRAPSKITKKADLYTIAKKLLASGVYALPVYEKNEVVGVVSVEKLLRSLLSDKTLLPKHISMDPPFTHTRDGQLRDVYSKLRDERTSRLLVLDDDGKVIGITTRRDVQEGLLPPTRKLRYGKNHGRRFRSVSFDEEKLKRLDYPLHEFMKRNVVTVDEKAKPQEILETMLDKKLTSVVVVDRNNHPKGIVTVRHFLEALSEMRPTEKVVIKLSDKHQKLVEKEKKLIIEALEHFAKKFGKHDAIKHIEVTANTYQNVNGKVTGFEIHLRVHLMNGRGAMTKVEDKKLSNALHEAIRKIEHQFSHK